MDFSADYIVLCIKTLWKQTTYQQPFILPVAEFLAFLSTKHQYIFLWLNKNTLFLYIFYERECF